MNLTVFSRLGVIIKPVGRGPVVAIVVPSRDRVNAYKDLEGKSSGEIAERYGASGQKILWRLTRGMTMVYGTVPEEITQIRYAVKIYLAEDFAHADDTSFFYLLSPQWIIHGNRTTDDEGQNSWRTTTLRITEKQNAAAIIGAAVSDLMLTNTNSKIVVAVAETLAKQAIPELANVLAPLGIKPVAFGALKSNLKAAPLYKHTDFSVVLYMLMLVAALVVLGTAGLWVAGKTELTTLNQNIGQVRAQIQAIQINKSLGHIRDPQPILDAISTSSRQQPSAILNAAAQVAKQFGELNKLEVELVAANQASGLASPLPGEGLQDMKVLATLDKAYDSLLVEQESRAKAILQQTPWVKVIENIGTAERPKLSQLVHISESPSTAPLPEAIPAPTPDEQAKQAIANAVSASDMVSATPVVSATENTSPSTPVQEVAP